MSHETITREQIENLIRINNNTLDIGNYRIIKDSEYFRLWAIDTIDNPNSTPIFSALNVVHLINYITKY